MGGAQPTNLCRSKTLGCMTGGDHVAVGGIVGAGVCCPAGKDPGDQRLVGAAAEEA